MASHRLEGSSDEDLFIDVCGSNLNIPRTDFSEQIASITRIGYPRDNKPKPCIERFKCVSLRDKVLRLAPNLKRLNESNRPLPPIIIAPDLTKLQQLEKTKLNAELKRRRDQNEDVVVRAGRIIPRPTGPRSQQINRTQSPSLTQLHTTVNHRNNRTLRSGDRS